MISCLARLLMVSLAGFAAPHATSAAEAVEVTAATAALTPQQIDHSLFDQVLKENVRDERVDYVAISRNKVDTLDKYLDQIAAADLSKLSRDEQLATYINLYNATVIKAVITRYHRNYTVAESKFKIFDEPLVRLKGRSVSLNDLENKIIRPTFKEPRIHVALVCAAVSCPPLTDKAFRAEGLSERLEAKMKAFVNDTSRNRIDVRNRKLQLSQIFNWYAIDFGGKSGVPKFVDRYHAASTSRYSLDFQEYSWALNVVK